MEKILAVLTAVLGGGWITQILFLRYERRRKKAETESMELDIDQKYDTVQQERLKQAYDQIVALQDIIDLERGKWVELAKKVSALKTELMLESDARRIAEYDRCTVKGCLRRIPPREQAAETEAVSF